MGLPLLWSFCPQTQASGLQAPAIIFIFELSLKNWAVFNLYSKRTQFFSFLNLTHQPQCVCQPCEISQLCWSRVGRGHNIQRSCDIHSNLFSVFELKKRQCIRVIRVNNHTGGMMWSKLTSKAPFSAFLFPSALGLRHRSAVSRNLVTSSHLILNLNM